MRNFILLTVILYLPYIVTSERGYTLEHLGGLCSGTKTFNVIDTTFVLKFQTFSPCSIMFLTQRNRRLMVYFKDVSLPSGGEIEVRDGAGWNSTNLYGAYSTFSGNIDVTNVATTKQNILYIILKSYRDSFFVINRMTIVVTSFYTGTCASRTCNNGRCVPPHVLCNGYNPCGDNSDCDKVYTGTIALGSTIGALVLIMVIIICVKCCRNCYCYVGDDTSRQTENNDRSSNRNNRIILSTLSEQVEERRDRTLNHRDNIVDQYAPPSYSNITVCDQNTETNHTTHTMTNGRHHELEPTCVPRDRDIANQDETFNAPRDRGIANQDEEEPPPPAYSDLFPNGDGHRMTVL